MIKIRKLIIFDLDGTLVDSKKPNIEAYQYGFMQMGLKIPESKQIKSLLGKEPNEMLELLGVPKELKNEIYEKYIKPKFLELLPKEASIFQNVHDVLKKLKHIEFSIVGLTSGNKQTQIPLVKIFGIENFFDFIMTSSDTEFRKPNPKLLEELFNKIHITPEEMEKIIYVDDREDGLLMAKNFGRKIKTIHASYGIEKNISIECDARISDISELLGVI